MKHIHNGHAFWNEKCINFVFIAAKTTYTHHYINYFVCKLTVIYYYVILHMMFVSALNIHLEQTSKITHRWHVYGLITTCQDHNVSRSQRVKVKWVIHGCVFTCLWRQSRVYIRFWMNGMSVKNHTLVCRQGQTMLGRGTTFALTVCIFYSRVSRCPVNIWFNVRLNASMSKVNVLICTVVLTLSI